jgi:hypothetical protein
MATTTPNLELTKPELTDQALITVINNDLDIIDGLWTSTNTVNVNLGGSGSAGSSSRVARADHVHGATGFGTPVSIGILNDSGVATTLARSDHVHAGSNNWTVISESIDLDAGTYDDVTFYLPTSPVQSIISIMGRLPKGGLVASHNHNIQSGTASGTTTSNTGHTHTFTSDNGNVGHTHTTTTGGDTGNHTHSGTSDGEAAHTHGGTSNAGTAHAHGSQNSGSHYHDIKGDDPFSPPCAFVVIDGTNGTQLPGNAYMYAAGTHNHTIDSESSHTHTFTSLAGSNHTHGFTTGNQLATHTHTGVSDSQGSAHTHTGTSNGEVTAHTHDYSAAHTHTSDSTGSGGYTTGTRPVINSILINGSERLTTVWGGSIGTSGSDWNNHNKDISSYITSSGSNSITINSSTGGRVKIQLWVRF